ncbi:hypothetical protein B0T24DRAFT_664956 [Lasiosphaeria ovina]|uniref:Cytosine-purine permease n=1 Tax=Lasiosphaeria ovina TaxID=92902 RepID=A0AAE0NA50_9PEZI|nr:hypothetical protein B0T24DRAFT_664956 [Lasiosphaeria ovina]
MCPRQHVDNGALAALVWRVRFCDCNMERMCDCDCDYIATAESQPVYHNQPRAWLSRAAAWTGGGEKRGMTPIPASERTDKRFANISVVWFTMSTDLLPIVTGMVGHAGVWDWPARLLAADPPLQSRVCAAGGVFQYLWVAHGAAADVECQVYVWTDFVRAGRYYPISVIVVLNLCTIAGLGVIDCVLGGSTLAAALGGKLDATAGIVIIALVSMVVCFGGIRVIHAYERYSPRRPPAEAAMLVGLEGVVAGFLIPWAAMTADFSVYCDTSASTFRIFAYTYAGLFFPTVPLMVLGAAIGSATPNMPEWAAGYAQHGVGGVLQAMLLPAGGFGRFVAVLLSLTVIGNLTTAMYSISLSFQLVLPVFVKIPRAVFVMAYTAFAIPVAIEAAKSFFAALENFIYLIAYWSAAFVAVVSAEHYVFRRGDCAAYDVAHWDHPSKLPTGLAAIGAMGLSFGLAVPCMSQVWYTGPLAEETGDIGFEVALVLAAILYLSLRWIELKYRPF